METLFIGRLVLTGLLYLFLAAVFVVLWQDMRARAPADTPPIRESDGRLIVLKGNSALPAGAVLPLQPFTSLGRGPANTIVVPDMYASAEHAIIALRGGQWWLEDCHSRNGTRLNDVPIKAPVVLGAGDVIRIGQIELKVESE